MSGYDYTKWDYASWYKKNDYLWDVCWVDRVITDTERRLPYIKDAQLRQEMQKSINESKDLLNRHYGHYYLESQKRNVIPDSKEVWLDTLRRVNASRM